MRSAALLRSVNVGGTNKVPMRELAACFAGLGLRDVETYIQSGNVVYTGETTQAVLRAAVRARFGLDTPVIVRTGAELAAVLAADPFPDADPRQHGVTFLEAPPQGALVGDPSPPDRHHLHGREVYLHVPNGFGQTKLTLDWIERRVGVPGTARNWNTLVALVERTG